MLADAAQFDRISGESVLRHRWLLAAATRSRPHGVTRAAQICEMCLLTALPQLSITRGPCGPPFPRSEIPMVSPGQVLRLPYLRDTRTGADSQPARTENARRYCANPWGASFDSQET